MQRPQTPERQQRRRNLPGRRVFTDTDFDLQNIALHRRADGAAFHIGIRRALKGGRRGDFRLGLVQPRFRHLYSEVPSRKFVGPDDLVCARRERRTTFDGGYGTRALAMASEPSLRVAR
jgi:hypothetical protein